MHIFFLPIRENLFSSWAVAFKVGLVRSCRYEQEYMNIIRLPFLFFFWDKYKWQLKDVCKNISVGRHYWHIAELDVLQCLLKPVQPLVWTDFTPATVTDLCLRAPAEEALARCRFRTPHWTLQKSVEIPALNHQHKFLGYAGTLPSYALDQQYIGN